MKFPTTTHDGLQFRVLLLPPNWARPVDVTHRQETKIAVGRTTIEERRPGRAVWLLEQELMLTLFASDADDWNKGLAALGNGRVATPLWPDARPVADWANRKYEPQKVINFDQDTGDFAIYDGDDLPAEPDYPLYAPLLLGYFSQRPPAETHAEDGADVTLAIAEASPYGWRTGVQTYGSGWTAEPNRIAPVRQMSELDAERFTLSAAREPAQDRTNAAVRWLQEAEFAFDGELEIRRALSVFADKRGAWATLADLPAWFQPGAASAATPDTLTARFASDALRLRYVAPDYAEAEIGFLQEIATPGRDQAQPGEEYLVRLRYAPDTGNPELLTGWDAPIAVSVGTFEPAQLALADLNRSLKLQDDRAELELAYVAGSLAADWSAARLFGDVELTIWKCDPDDAEASLVEIFSGLVDDVLPEGNVLRVTASKFGDLLEQEAPGWSFGPICNVALFSTPCGLAEEDFDSAGTIEDMDISADGTTLTVHSVTGFGGTTYAEGWFAGGKVTTGAGRATQTATVLASEMSGDNVVLKLNRRFWPDLVPSSQAATLLPGCGGQYETDCGTKFSNQVNFRGFPFVPEYIEARASGSPRMKK
jgi:uncharacterized phage protein (TIGR02218 family)